MARYRAEVACIQGGKGGVAERHPYKSVPGPYEFQGTVKNLVLTVAKALQRRNYRDVGLKAHALELAAIDMAHIVAREWDHDSPWKHHHRHIPVGPRRR